MNRRLSWKKLALLATMSAVGLWASSMVLVIYNTLHHQLPGCTVPTSGSTGIQINCDKVLSSSYSSIFGVPLEVFAVGYFIVNLVLIYFVTFGTDRIFRASFRTLFIWRFIGLCIVPYLVTVELFFVKAICLYCTVMHASIIIDFAIISYFLYYRNTFLSISSSSSESGNPSTREFELDIKRNLLRNESAHIIKHHGVLAAMRPRRDR